MALQTPPNVRHTVCPAIVNTQTSYIAWHDAEHAASIGAAPVSPFKPKTPNDREWLRHYNRARTAPSGVSSFGLRVLA